MILVDTSVWADHFRDLDVELVRSLEAGEVLAHPFVIGEIAMGNLKARAAVIEALSALPAAPVASDAEALAFVDRHALHGRGIGWIDVHLLASARLADGARLWTRDKRLRAAAVDLGLAGDLA